MECHVKANPPSHTIMWFHQVILHKKAVFNYKVVKLCMMQIIFQGRQLGSSNETSGIHIKGMTLFISYLTPQIGGDFNCEAVNDIGKGISNTLPIELRRKFIVPPFLSYFKTFSITVSCFQCILARKKGPSVCFSLI